MSQPNWNTTSGNIGTYPALVPFTYQLSASPVSPATSLTYVLISGSLPIGVTMTVNGLISGTPAVGTTNTTYPFVVRATDNNQNIRDRTFNIVISGVATPKFTTPHGSIYTTNDSTWVEIPLQYTNLISTNPILISLIEGELPPGIEINDNGIIRGYAEPPLIEVTLPIVNTAAVASINNTFVCLSTTGFAIGRPIVFSGTIFGGVVSGQTYYITSIIDQSTFTVSTTVNGPNLVLTNAVGYMTTTLPNINVGEPTIQTYSFILKLSSPLGDDNQSYSITVINQNTPIDQGGPGFPPHTRVPAIYNTKPETYNLNVNQTEFGYYVLPPHSNGNTYAPNQPAYISQINSGDFFAFKILGHDFDGDPLQYTYSSLPLGMIGDTVTGWITGSPMIADNNISQYNFSVSVNKSNKPNIATTSFNFQLNVSNDINGVITWITPANMGTINNSSTSILKVQATSDVALSYRLVSGNLPPNLTLAANGEIIGVVPYQPTNSILTVGEQTTFTFTVEAYSPLFPIINASQTFNVVVYQQYENPTDILYIKCVPSIADRNLLASLLDNSTLIPDQFLYREDDPNFGKATSIIYQHAYGISASDFDQYVAAITKNHYWRNITLGQLNTAVAKDSNGNTIYEVVYSQIIDNLVNPNDTDVNYNNYDVETQSNIITPYGESVAKEIYWDRPIPLNLGPWYTSETDIFASYIGGTGPTEGTISNTSATSVECNSTIGLAVGDFIIFIGTPFGGIALNTTYYVVSILDSTHFMIALTLGGTPIEFSTASGEMSFLAWTDPNDYYTSLTPGSARTLYPNSLPNMREQVADVLGEQYTIGILPDWMSSQQPNGSTLGYVPAWVIAYCLPGTTTLPDGTTGTYAQYIQYQIQNNWKDPAGELQTLNTINFKIDRFTVNKSSTYNYDTNISPPAWSGLPSATPTPNPVDSDDFYVLFPTVTILPDETQY